MPTAVAAVYQESSQFKRWSLSAEELRKRRESVNESTIVTVKANIEEEQQLRGSQATRPADFPSADEELLIIDYYAAKVYETGNVFNLPSHLKATAASYLRRFFLAKSVLQYHPKKIMITCLFLATKTCEHHIDLDTFVKSLPKQTKEAVLEHEFLISSAIEFDFVHWSAYRPLYGFILDLESSIEAEDEDQKTKKARIAQTSKLHDAAKSLINGCIWSDLPFLYTPSHLALAAMHASDPLMVAEYLKHKNLASLIPKLEEIGAHVKQTSATRFDSAEMMAKVKAADKKVYYSSDPALKKDSALYKKREEENADQEYVKRQKKSDAARESQEAFGTVLA